MQIYSIKDVENLTGIRSHTLRMWEFRYKIFSPKRKESQHRFYDDSDIRFLLRVAKLYEMGFSISKIATFSDEEMKAKILTELKDEKDAQINTFISNLIKLSASLDYSAFDKLVNHIFIYYGVERAMINVMYPFLEKMGTYWLVEKIHSANEHFASNQIRKKLIQCIDGIDKHYFPNSLYVLLFCPKNEEHEIPLLFIHYLLRKKGVPVLYLGANTDIEILKSFVDKQNVGFLHTHILTKFNDIDYDEYVKELINIFPCREIIISGPISGIINYKHNNLKLIKGQNELINHLRNFLATPTRVHQNLN